MVLPTSLTGKTTVCIQKNIYRIKHIILFQVIRNINVLLKTIIFYVLSLNNSVCACICMHHSSEEGDQKCIHNYFGGIVCGCGHLEGLGDGMVIQGLMKSISLNYLKQILYLQGWEVSSLPSRLLQPVHTIPVTPVSVRSISQTFFLYYHHHHHHKFICSVLSASSDLMSLRLSVVLHALALAENTLWAQLSVTFFVRGRQQPA